MRAKIEKKKAIIKLPSKKEAVRETRKRILIANKIKNKLNGVSEEILVVGSVAFGADYSVNPNSDLDLLVIIKSKNCKKLLKIFKGDIFLKEAVSLMEKNKIENFTLDMEINKIKVQLHFWEETAHKKARILKLSSFRRLTTSKKEKLLPALDFRGNQYSIPRISKKYNQWYIKTTPIYCIIDDSFIPLQTINNLLSVPKIIYTKNKKLQEDINILIKKIAKRLNYENSLSKGRRSILACLWKNWNFSPQSKKKLSEILIN
ncbi:MAG: hypothetical protein WC852_04865 [Candidatus Nanoarchaeia archaeon]|jgi:predicted nucleotidyltransferase